MTTHPDLFDLPYRGEAPSQKHSRTSQEAAHSIRKSIGPLHTRVLNYLAAHPLGATDEHLMRELDLGGNTLRPRRRELQLMGLIADSGRTDLTQSGRSAVVWVLDQGRS